MNPKTWESPLFIHTEHRRVARRVQVRPDDIGGLGFKVRIVACHVALKPRRFQTSFLPGAMHDVFADTESRSQFAAFSSHCVAQAALTQKMGIPWIPRPARIVQTIDP
jgi:hypothetical protein